MKTLSSNKARLRIEKLIGNSFKLSDTQCLFDEDVLLAFGFGSNEKVCFFFKCLGLLFPSFSLPFIGEDLGTFRAPEMMKSTGPKLHRLHRLHRFHRLHRLIGLALFRAPEMWSPTDYTAWLRNKCTDWAINGLSVVGYSGPPKYISQWSRNSDGAERGCIFSVFRDPEMMQERSRNRLDLRWVWVFVVRLKWVYFGTPK